jgi:Family of unknown function (DUF6011)
MSEQAKFTTAAAAKQFMLGGNATVTLVSLMTGTRFTYKVRESDDGGVWFVSLLTGPDNEADYRYLGRIAGESQIFWQGRKNPKPGDVSAQASSSKAFAYTWNLLKHERLHGSLEIWHEGRCGRCNRKLTVPSSIASGFGPECVKMECI